MNDFYDINVSEIRMLVNMTEYEKEQNCGNRFRPFFEKPQIEGFENNYE